MILQALFGMNSTLIDKSRSAVLRSEDAGTYSACMGQCENGDNVRWVINGCLRGVHIEPL